MRSRPRSTTALLGACLLLLSGAPVAHSVPPSTSPPSTPTTAPATQPPSTPSSGGCAAAFCDDFSSSSSGWDTGNEPHFFSKYSSYLGGTLRMGERHDAVLTVPAPYVITKAAADSSVQIDVDVILASDTARHSLYGVSCWNHAAHNGETSAFLFYVSHGGAQIVLWDNADGSEHVLKHKSWSNVLRPGPYRNVMRVLCLQRHNRGGTVAELGMSLNGKVLTAFYAKSTKHHDWRVSDRVGLIVGLNKSDVFYDNFAITGECKGSRC
jgi:hypothetical protein